MSEDEELVRQPGSQNCFVCGKRNPIGLNVSFYQKGNQVFTHFTPGPEHQGYPDRMHGGIACTLLDETVGRAGFISGCWTFTAKFEVRYRKPVPLGREITVVGEMVRDRGRMIEAKGQLLLDDGTVAVEASGLFVKLKPDELEAIEEEIGEME
ncbi:MAG TPA: PaaI family thioesterase [Chloroflexota bacterium]|nr:PaaI family thioesterase [Chloroflexota bacterium]